MTRIEIIKEHQKRYVNYKKEIENMTGLEKVVAENLVLEWIKGNNWLGGISDSKYQKISDKLSGMGYDEMDVYDEFERQIMKF